MGESLLSVVLGLLAAAAGALEGDGTVRIAGVALGDSFLADGLDKGAPPLPKGATCLTLMSTETGSTWYKDPVFRFSSRTAS